MPTMIDLDAIEARANNAMRMTWGNYNVYPYLKIILDLIAEIRSLRAQLHDARLPMDTPT